MQILTKTHLLNVQKLKQLNPVHNNQRRPFLIHAGNHTITLGSQTCIMGIINATPDSFSDDGCYSRLNKNDVLQKTLALARKMIRQGASIIDVGGESSRPGARQISVDEEIQRVVPIIKMLSQKIPVPISIDTYKPEVAEQALNAGAVIVNNIKGTQLNKKLIKIVLKHEAAVILMHMQGNPKNMQKNIQYKDVTTDILKKLKKSIENYLEMGVKSDRIIIDPGIGFGKTVEHNLEILNRLRVFSALKQPLLIGASRKSFIGKILNKPVHKRSLGTAAALCAAILNGAHIVRVHDVKEAKETVDIIDAVINEKI